MYVCTPQYESYEMNVRLLCVTLNRDVNTYICKYLQPKKMRKAKVTSKQNAADTRHLYAAVGPESDYVFVGRCVVLLVLFPF